MNLCILGHRDTGKKWLAELIQAELPEIHPILPDESGPFSDDFDYPPLDRLQTVNKTAFPDEKPDKALLMVSLADGPMPGTRIAIELIKSLDIPPAGLLLTHNERVETSLHEKKSMHTPEQLRRMVRIEALELLSSYGFDDSALPVCCAELAVPRDRETLLSFLKNCCKTI